MRKTTKRQRTLRHESLESRQLLAIAAFDFNIYSDDNGRPGDLIPQAVVHAGDRFYVEITAQEFDPRSAGLAGISLDINWAPSVLQVVEEEFDPAKIITDRMPLLKDGFLRNPRGGIDNLRALSLASFGGGEDIGNGQADRFAMIPFVAIAPATNTPLWMQVGGSQIGLDTAAALNRDHIRFENQLVQVLPAELPEAITSNLTTDVNLEIQVNNTSVSAGQVITASISATDSRASSQGISGLGVNVNWDPQVLKLIPPSSGNIGDALNSKLSLFRDGTINQAAGTITDLAGSALPAAGIGEPIGIGQPEAFAELQFRVLAPAESTTISVQAAVSGVGLVGADSATTNAASISIKTIAETDSPKIAVSLSGENQDQITFATRDGKGKVISPLVRPANPDSSQSITIRNEGTSLLHVDRIESIASHVTIEGSQGFSIAPGQSQTLQVTYAPDGNRPATWRPELLSLARGIVVHSDAANIPELVIGLAGQSTFDADINFDGRVDLTDISRFNNHFGKRTGAADYSRANDPNGDGIVDLGDMGILNAQYGKRIEYSADQAPGMEKSPVVPTTSLSPTPSSANVASAASQQSEDEFDALLEELAQSQMSLPSSSITDEA